MNGQFSERVMPHAIEAEASVIGCMLLDPLIIPLVANRLKVTDFFATRHGWVYQAILSVASSGTVVDLVTVSAYLGGQPGVKEKETLLDSIGGIVPLSGFLNAVVSARNFMAHVDIVAKKAALRQVIKSALELSDAAYTADDPEEIIAEAQTKLQAVKVGPSGKELEGLETIDKWFQDYSTAPDTSLIPTGLDDLDEVLDMRRGEVVAIAGPSKGGKSTLARQIALNMAEAGNKVLYFSLEETKESQFVNFLSLQSGVPRDLLRRKYVKAGDGIKGAIVSEAARKLKDSLIRFDYVPFQRIGEVVAKLDYAAMSWGVDVVILDTQNALASDRARDERSDQEMTRVVRMFDAACKRNNCLGIVVIQGKMDILSRDSFWMTATDISESRGMVQALTSIIGLVNPALVNNPKSHIVYGNKKLFAADRRWRNVVALFTIAARNNPTGGVTPLYHDRATGRFRDLLETAYPWNAPENTAPDEKSVKFKAPIVRQTQEHSY